MPTNFKKVDGLVDSMMKAALQGIGDDVKKRSQILAPKDTGALRRSAKVHLNSTKDTVTVSYNTLNTRDAVITKIVSTLLRYTICLTHLNLLKA